VKGISDWGTAQAIVKLGFQMPNLSFMFFGYCQTIRNQDFPA
jgi:hypothetical protein